MRIRYLGLVASTLVSSLASPVDWEQRSFHSLDEPNEIRSLQLGQINFLQTTDTHGWLGSHPNQPDYDADWGDFVSFVDLFKRNRLGLNSDKGGKQDLLIIDTGDKHDGSGYSDATSPNGLESTKIFNEMDYDLLTLGNHELYDGDRASLEYYSTVMSSKFKDKYVASNVDFILDDGTRVPFGNRYVYLETSVNKIKILTFSFIFNFQKENNRAKVTSPVESLQEEWFIEAISKYPEDKIDMIIVFGHTPARDDTDHELLTIHQILRQYYPDIIIQYFGGHSHIRDFVQFDSKATCLQSGRFAETVGFLSIDNVSNSSPLISRRYIDFNKRSFKYHSNSTTLATERGAKVSHKLKLLRQSLQLDRQYGVTPRNYYMMTRPIDSEENIYQMIKSHVLPLLQSTLVESDTLSPYRYVMLNTGAVRFDLYRGPFTKDTEYSVLPFANVWQYIKLNSKVAREIEGYLNKLPIIAKLSPPQQLSLSHGVVSHGVNGCPFITDPGLSEGYTTWDDFGCDGDDTPHKSQRIYPLPNVIQYNNLAGRAIEDDDNDDIIVDFIFFSFLSDDILKAVNQIDETRRYNQDDIMEYGGKSAKELLREFISGVSST